MANDVTVRLTAEDAQLVAAWKRARQAQDAFEQGLRNTATEANRTDAALGKMLTSGTANVGKFVAAFTGVGSVVAGIMALANQLKAEYQNLIARQKAARDTQLGIAEAQREAAKALAAGDKTASLDFMQTEVSRISQSTGANQAAVYSAISSALGAKPAGVSDKDVIEAAGVAARLSPTNPAALETNLSAFMFQRAATGGSWEDIAGYQMRLKGLSPTKSEESFARNIAPAIGRGKGFGVSPDEQSGLLAYFGTQMGDTEGMVTANAVTNFEKQLFELTAGKVDGGAVARLKFLQTEAGKAARAKLIGPLAAAEKGARSGKGGEAFGITGEAKAFSTILGLVQGQDIAALEKTIGDVGTTAGSGDLFRTSTAAIDAMPLQQNARAQRLIDAAAQNIQAQDIRGGRGAISREGLMKILQTTGATDITQKLALARFEAITSGGTDAAGGALGKSLGGLADDLLRPQATGRKVTQPVYNPALRNIVTGEPVRVGSRIVDEMRPATDQDRATAAQLRELATLLKEAFREVKIEPKVNIVNDAERPKAVPSTTLGRPRP